MEWLIVCLVASSLLGSFLWIKPTPRETRQSALRMHARQLGFRVQMSSVEMPRAIGEVEAQKVRVAAYRLFLNAQLCNNHSAHAWMVSKVSTYANAGLPEGWCWKYGERSLSKDDCARLYRLLEKMPTSVVAVESTKDHLSVYWREVGDLDTLNGLYELLNAKLLEGW